MTGINHAMTGAIIGAVVEPVIALPLAIVSHFVLDAIPHYGDGTGTQQPASKRLQLAIKVDALLVILLLVAILLWRPTHWPVMLGGAILAMSPDLMWLPAYLRHLRQIEPKERNWIMRAHQKIQWCERTWGITVEAVWFVVAAAILFGIGK